MYTRQRRSSSFDLQSTRTDEDEWHLKRFYIYYIILYKDRRWRRAHIIYLNYYYECINHVSGKFICCWKISKYLLIIIINYIASPIWTRIKVLIGSSFLLQVSCIWIYDFEPHCTQYTFKSYNNED